MAEYISREAVNNLIEDMQNNRLLLVCERTNLYILKSKVAELPAADVQPVKRGKWEKDEKRNSFEKFCSVCKHEAYWDTDYGQQLFDYCPYCGAKMEQEN